MLPYIAGGAKPAISSFYYCQNVPFINIAKLGFQHVHGYNIIVCTVYEHFLGSHIYNSSTPQNFKNRIDRKTMKKLCKTT